MEDDTPLPGPLTRSPMSSIYRLLCRALPLGAGALGATAAVASADPVAPGPPTSLPSFEGSAATPHAIPPSVAPQNPFMAKNPNNNIHDDTWMTDTYQRSGPLGNALQTSSGAYSPSVCGSLAFDTAGRIVSVCPSIIAAPQARIFDPTTLSVLATYDMPDAPSPPGTLPFQNFTGGGYFFLDNKDRIWSATKTSHLFVLAERDDGHSLVKVADYDLSKVLKPDQRISSALPDFQGRIWFVSKKDGVIGVLDRRTGKIKKITLAEEVENSFAVDSDGVYIASDKRMYRFNAGKDDKPVVTWKVKYKNSGIHKPSQINAGTGTTPTVMPGGYVTITDNADPMNVVVYRTAAKLAKGQKRTVCEVPVFARGGAPRRTRSSPPAGRCSSRTTTATRTRSDPTPAHRRPRASPAWTSTATAAAASGAGRTRPTPRRRWSPRSRQRPACSTPTSRRPTPTARSRGTGRPSTPGPARRSGASSPAPASPSTTTTPACRSAPTAPPTSPPSAACRR
jgi:hypothetical protein